MSAAKLTIVASGEVTCTEHPESRVYMLWGWSPVCSECLRIEVAGPISATVGVSK